MELHTSTPDTTAKLTTDVVVPTNALSAAVIAWWMKLAPVLDLAPPTRRDVTRAELHGAVQRRASIAPDPVLRGIWRQLDQLLEIDVDYSDDVGRLLYVVGANVRPPSALPPPRRKRWTQADVMDPEILKVTGLCGLSYPLRPSDEPFEAELRPVRARLAAAEEAKPRDWIRQITGTERDRERDEAEARQRSIPELERLIGDGEEHRREAFAAWSEAFDSVRRRCLATVDHAIARITDPLVRVCLDQLGRAGRHCERRASEAADPRVKLTSAVSPADALAVITGAVQFETQPDPISGPEAQRTIRVKTRMLPRGSKPLARRKCAGHLFGPTPRQIVATELELEEIERDDALEILGDDVSWEVLAARARIADLEAENAQLRAGSAPRSNAPPDSGDAPSSRPKVAASLRRKPSNPDPDDDESGGGF